MSASPWSIGQRVRSEAEPSLGLGLVVAHPHPRCLEVSFPAAGERRLYNPASAPLHRYALAVGQTVHSRAGLSFRIEEVELGADGLLTYLGAGVAVPEAELADASAANDPLSRLLAGDLGPHETFALRRRAWRLRSELLQARTRGLLGGRVALLPHQLAIAHKVATREFPRALLADEVGLGKTIEACLIFAALRALGRADRVLVLTPASLVHQWLVELYRRFNELFTVAHSDLPQGLGLVAACPEENPFAQAPRVIASVDWLLEPGRLEAALEQSWDLVIVDEAHHLTWSPAHASPGYQAVEAIARRSQGLLLLTATPLRAGLETEFGLLRLVDPERFTDFPEFEAEQAQLRQVADLARRLSRGEPVGAELRGRFPEASWDGPVDECLQQLIDRHGTGRVLFRNRRAKLGGFPGRQLHLSVLPLPEAWRGDRAWPEVGALEQWLGLPVTPGRQPAAAADPRWDWVLATVRALGDQKVLLMASSTATVQRLEQLFRRATGIPIAIFHEQLGLVERDRQAAYFADPEGAQVLISSEIGGEGRNFQFCHHLLMVDLPLHPDALEQRIGRLDRIGQTGTIELHLAVVEHTPGEALFAWHHALRLFETPLTGGEQLMAAQAPALLEVLRAATPTHHDRTRREAFLARTSELLLRHQADVQAGIDFLIDLNSFDQVLGTALVEEIRARDTARLQAGVSELLEHFGIEEEDLAQPGLSRIRPGHLMKVEPFPGLRPDGYLATYDRGLALAREEIQLLSPDHPLVEGALGLLLDRSEGRASAALWPGAPEQTVRIEFLFVLEAVGPSRLGLARFLPPTSLSLLLDLDGRPCEEAPDTPLHPLSARTWTQLAALLQDRLPLLLDKGEQLANARLQPQVAAALAAADGVLGAEQRRLEELGRLRHVSATEVRLHAERVLATRHQLAQAQVSLDAIRVLVLSP